MKTMDHGSSTCGETSNPLLQSGDVKGPRPPSNGCQLAVRPEFSGAAGKEFEWKPSSAKRASAARHIASRWGGEQACALTAGLCRACDVPSVQDSKPQISWPRLLGYDDSGR